MLNSFGWGLTLSYSHLESRFEQLDVFLDWVFGFLFIEGFERGRSKPQSTCTRTVNIPVPTALSSYKTTMCSVLYLHESNRDALELSFRQFLALVTCSLALSTCFPALGSSFLFSRPWQRLHVLFKWIELGSLRYLQLMWLVGCVLIFWRYKWVCHDPWECVPWWRERIVI